MHNHRLTEGTLKVEVIESSRLALVDLAVEVYCTLELCKSAFVYIIDWNFFIVKIFSISKNHKNLIPESYFTRKRKLQ